MPQQYVATDRRTGLEVTVTGTFPDDPDDRMRIARTATLFTRLFATILAMPAPADRREGFRAIETQLEVAEALLRGDMAEVQAALRRTIGQMGITEEQLAALQDQLREQLADLTREAGAAELEDGDGPPAVDRDRLERGPFGAAFADAPFDLSAPATPDTPDPPATPEAGGAADTTDAEETGGESPAHAESAADAAGAADAADAADVEGEAERGTEQDNARDDDDGDAGAPGA